MSSGVLERLRKVWALVLLVVEIFLIGQFIRSFQPLAIARDVAAAEQRQASHNDIKDQLDKLELWQQSQDKDAAIQQAQLKMMEVRIASIEKKEDDEQKAHVEEIKTITEMKTIIEQNQSMARGTVIGVAILVGGRLLEFLGMSLVTGSFSEKLRKFIGKKKGQ